MKHPELINEIDEHHHYDRLYNAILNLDIVSLKAQLTAGADPNIVDNPKEERGALLRFAIFSGFLEGALLLLQHGANVNGRDSNGAAPLALTRAMIEEDALAMARALLAAGADVDSCDKDGRTALYEAAILAYANVCKLLIEHGADVEKETIYGYRPLRAIAGRDTPRNIETMRVLIKGGASPSALPSREHLRGDARRSAFQIAVAFACLPQMSFFLEECGEDPDQKTAEGLTLRQLTNNEQALELLHAASTERAVTASIDGPSSAPIGSIRGTLGLGSL